MVWQLDKVHSHTWRCQDSESTISIATRPPVLFKEPKFDSDRSVFRFDLTKFCVFIPPDGRTGGYEESSH